MPDDERNPFPIERLPGGGYRLRETVCWDCGATYVHHPSHLRGDQHRAWIKANQTTIVPEDTIPEDEDVGVEGKKLVFGEDRVCPRCRGTLRPERKSPRGDILPADTFTHDPIDKDGRCSKCGGTGVVQVKRVG